MIKPRIAVENKICLVFDTVPKGTQWLDQDRISGTTGIKAVVDPLRKREVSIADSVSIIVLADVDGKAKASDFKVKALDVKETFETYAFNVCVPIGAGATEKMLGFKGASKYFGKVMVSDAYPGLKIIPCPNPAAAMYDPSVTEKVDQAMQTVVDNMEFPEVVESAKRPLTYHTIDTIEAFRAFRDFYLSDAVELFAFDTETSGFRFNQDSLLTIQFSHKETESYLIPTNFYEVWSPAEWDEIADGIRRIFADETKTVIAHNLKFDMLFVHHHLGVKIRKTNTFDTMIAHFLIDDTQPHGLKDLACHYTDLGDYEFELEKWKKLYCKRNKVKVSDFSYKYIPLSVLTFYAQADPDVTLRLYNIFKDLLVVEEQVEVFAMVMRFQYLLTIMEKNGSPVDVEYAQDYLTKLDPQIEQLEKDLLNVPCVKTAEAKINEGVKKPLPFNFNSTNQKRVLFYDVLGQRFAFFPKIKNDIKTMSVKRKESVAKRLYKDVTNKDYPVKEHFSKSDFAACFRPKAAVDKRSLNLWHKETESEEVKSLIDLLKRYSELVKIRNTYVASVLEKTINGRVHPKFNVIGARSGRLSSSDPGYQNIPAHSDEAKKVKRITKAPEGYVISGSDLSAAEMRWVTVASGDEKMATIFNSGVDSHGAIAKEIFDLDCSANEVKEKYSNYRQLAKSCQFLSIYGGKGDALAATAGISTERAQEILDAYFDKYTGIANYIAQTEAYIKVHGYAKSLLGRKNRHPNVPVLAAKIGNGLTNQELMEMEKGLRVGVNATIQSVSSDGMLIAVCALQDEIEERDLPMQIFNVIHDAVYVLIREDFVEEGNAVILKHLSTWPSKLISPFTGEIIIPPISMVGDCEVGPSWDVLKEPEYAVEEEEDQDEEED